MQGSNPALSAQFVTPENSNHSLLSLISQRPAVTIAQIVELSHLEKARPTLAGLTCFRRLVAGTGSLQLSSQRTRALPFRSVGQFINSEVDTYGLGSCETHCRSAAFQNLGLLPEVKPVVPMVTLLKTSGKRKLENVDEVLLHLRERFPYAVFASLESTDIGNMSVKEQVTFCPASFLCDYVMSQ